MRTAPTTFIACVLLAAFVACRPAPQAVVDPAAIALTTVQLVLLDEDGIAPAGTDGELLRSRVASRLRTRFVVDDAAPEGWEIFVRVEFAIGEDAVVGSVAAIAEPSADGPEPIELVRQLEVGGQAWIDTGRDRVSSEVDAIVDDLCDAVFVVRSDDAELTQAIAVARPALLPIAAREAQRRGLTDAVGPLIGRLPDAGPQSVVVVIGALSVLGTHDAVGPIIEAIDLDDAELVLAVLPALASIGGPEATGFLSVVADAHASARVRLAARELLRGMQ